MQKKAGVFLIIFLCLVSILGSKLLMDTEGPQIIYPFEQLKVACSLKYEDLLKGVEASDPSGVQELFVEESDLNEIIAHHKLTYVAIDGHKNVSKRQVRIKTEPAINEYHIVQLKEAVFEMNEPYDLKDYFVLSNGCGWHYPAEFKLEGLQIAEVGEYEVLVSVSDDLAVEPLTVRAEVVDSFSPRIALKYEALELAVNEYFDYRLAIKELSDDEDDYDYLYGSLELDGDVDVTLPGQYVLTFKIHDSSGREAQARLRVVVKEANVGEE